MGRLHSLPLLFKLRCSNTKWNLHKYLINRSLFSPCLLETSSTSITPATVTMSSPYCEHVQRPLMVLVIDGTEQLPQGQTMEILRWQMGTAWDLDLSSTLRQTPKALCVLRCQAETCCSGKLVRLLCLPWSDSPCPFRDQEAALPEVAAKWQVSACVGTGEELFQVCTALERHHCQWQGRALDVLCSHSTAAQAHAKGCRRVAGIKSGSGWVSLVSLWSLPFQP